MKKIFAMVVGIGGISMGLLGVSYALPNKTAKADVHTAYAGPVSTDTHAPQRHLIRVQNILRNVVRIGKTDASTTAPALAGMVTDSIFDR